MTKCIFCCVIFQLFLDSLPQATRYKIPQGLREKISKFTQNSYCRYKSSLPLSLDTTYYKSELPCSVLARQVQHGGGQTGPGAGQGGDGEGGADCGDGLQLLEPFDRSGESYRVWRKGGHG